MLRVCRTPGSLYCLRRTSARPLTPHTVDLTGGEYGASTDAGIRRVCRHRLGGQAGLLPRLRGLPQAPVCPFVHAARPWRKRLHQASAAAQVPADLLRPGEQPAGVVVPLARVREVEAVAAAHVGAGPVEDGDPPPTRTRPACRRPPYGHGLHVRATWVVRVRSFCPVGPTCCSMS